jgi:small conductance mechanosensitive channel
MIPVGPSTRVAALYRINATDPPVTPHQLAESHKVMCDLLLLQFGSGFLPIAESMFDTSLIWQTIRNITRGFLSRLPLIAMGILVWGLFLIAGSVLAGIVRRAGPRAHMNVNLTLLLSRLGQLLVGVFGFFVGSVIVFPGFQPGDLVAGLGITSVAIGFAFKDILQNFFAGILLLWRQPFTVGDEIQSGEFTGIVETINTRSTRIRTYDGQRVVLPNADVYTRAIIVNTAFPARRVKVVVGIGYQDSIEEAQRLIVAKLREIDEVLEDPAPAVFTDAFGASSVDLKVYFWIKSKGVNLLLAKHNVLKGIKDTLDRAGIDIAYPHTVVMLDRPEEVREALQSERAEPVPNNGRR